MIVPLIFGSIGWGELVLLAFIILLLFGAKRIPELMKSLGKGVKSFKDGVKEIDDQINLSDSPKSDADKTDPAGN